MKRWLALLLCLSACQPHLLPARPALADRHTVDYPSGLRLVVEADPGSQRVAMVIRVAAGAAQDPAGREGLAHLLEHLTFRARSSDGSRARDDEADLAGIASFGPRANALTSVEATAWVGVAPSSRVADAFPVMLSFVTHPLDGVDDTALELERNIVLSERYDSDPHSGGAVADALAASVLPPTAPGARPIGGTEASVRAISRGDLDAFQRAHYVPSRLTVALVGDVTLDAAKELVQSTLPAEWLTVASDSPRARVESLVPPPPELHRAEVHSRVRRRLLIFSWAVPGHADPTASVLPLVERHLERSLSKPRGVLRLAGSVRVAERTSVLSLLAELEDNANPDEISRQLRAQEMLGASWLADELPASAQALAEEQSLLARALRASSHGTAPPGADERRRLLEAFVQRGLPWRNAREVLVVPYHPAATQGDLATPTAPPRVVDLSSADLSSVALGPPLGETRSFTLENGLQVLISRRTSVPVASVALGLPARALHAPAVIGTFLGNTLDWNQREADQDFLGRPTVEVGADATVVQLSGDSRAAPLMLDTLGGNLPPAVFDFEAEDARRATTWLLRQGARRGAEALGVELQLRERLREVMPARSTAVPPSTYGLRATVQNVTPADFRAFAQLVWRPDGAWLVIDGDVDLAPTEAKVRALFSRWKRGASPMPPAAPQGAAPEPRRRVLVSSSAATPMTTVRLVCRLPAGGANDVSGVAVLTSALESSFEDELRHTLGLTYGVRVDATRWMHEENALVLRVMLSPANGEAVLRRFLEKLGELERVPWSEERLGRARWHVAKEHLGARLASRDVAAELARLGAAGVPAGELTTRALRHAQAPLTLIQDAWRSCVETRVLELDGQRSAIEAVLRELQTPPLPP